MTATQNSLYIMNKCACMNVCLCVFYVSFVWMPFIRCMSKCCHHRFIQNMISSSFMCKFQILFRFLTLPLGFFLRLLVFSTILFFIRISSKVFIKYILFVRKIIANRSCYHTLVWTFNSVTSTHSCSNLNMTAQSKHASKLYFKTNTGKKDWLHLRFRIEIHLN